MSLKKFNWSKIKIDVITKFKVCTRSNTKNDKTIFRLTKTIHNISEINSSFHVKWRNAGNFSFPFFSSFFLVSTKALFWDKDWALGYNSMIF